MEPSYLSTSSNFYYQALSFYTPRNPSIITKSPFSNNLFSSISVPRPSLSFSQVLISIPLQSLVSSAPVSVSKSPSPSTSDALNPSPISHSYPSEIPDVIPYSIPNPDHVPTRPPLPSSQCLPNPIQLESLSLSTDSSLLSVDPSLSSLSSPPPAAVLNLPDSSQVSAIQSYVSTASSDPLEDPFQSFSPTSSRRSISKKFAKLQELLPPIPILFSS